MFLYISFTFRKTTHLVVVCKPFQIFSIALDLTSGVKNGESPSTRTTPESQQVDSDNPGQHTSATSSAGVMNNRPNLPPITQDSKGRLTAGTSNPILRESSIRQGGGGISPYTNRPVSARPGSAGRYQPGRPGSARIRTRTNSANNNVPKRADYKYRYKTINDLT